MAPTGHFRPSPAKIRQAGTGTSRVESLTGAVCLRTGDSPELMLCGRDTCDECIHQAKPGAGLGNGETRCYEVGESFMGVKLKF